MTCRKGKSPVRPAATHLLCPKCKQYQAVQEYYINRRQPQGLSCWCKPCSRAVVKDYQKRVREEFKDVCVDSGSKPCMSCGQVKPLTAFYRSACSRDGKHQHCKDCWCAPMLTAVSPAAASVVRTLAACVLSPCYVSWEPVGRCMNTHPAASLMLPCCRPANCIAVAYDERYVLECASCNILVKLHMLRWPVAQHGHVYFTRTLTSTRQPVYLP